jgi:hypothetical protein
MRTGIETRVGCDRCDQAGAELTEGGSAVVGPEERAGRRLRLAKAFAYTPKPMLLPRQIEAIFGPVQLRNSGGICYAPARAR